ncbi:MAG: DUF1440 domain-containing protein [Gemmatimonadota bacterium]
MIGRLLTGAVAGIAGTAAMTVVMNPGSAGKLPLRWRPDEFVPRQVVQWLEAISGRPYSLDEAQEQYAAALAHVGYGAGMGAIYALLSPGHRYAPPAAAGAAWGLLVWAIGYQGWMPAAGVRPPTTHQPPSKWPVPIGSHLVYGVVTALAYAEMSAPRVRKRVLRLKV